jgi:hypothetical protein
MVAQFGRTLTLSVGHPRPAPPPILLSSHAPGVAFIVVCALTTAAKQIRKTQMDELFARGILAIALHPSPDKEQLLFAYAWLTCSM